jgi:hypothetical protein
MEASAVLTMYSMLEVKQGVDTPNPTIEIPAAADAFFTTGAEAHPVTLVLEQMVKMASPPVDTHGSK